MVRVSFDAVLIRYRGGVWGYTHHKAVWNITQVKQSSRIIGFRTNTAPAGRQGE